MRLLIRSFALAGVACIAALIPLWMRMIASPAPQEMREGAMLLSTIALLDGRNPYAFDSLPVAANVYGPLYPLVTAPLAAVMGPSLFVHRLVDGIGILGACGILYGVLRRAAVERAVALAGAAINLAGLLYWVGPASRPDGLGMALMLGAYAVMAPEPGRRGRFALGLGLSLLGFATKIYFVLPAFVAAACVARASGIARGVWLLATAMAALLVTLVGLALLFPAWAPTVLGANLDAASYDVAHLVRQSADWAIFSVPLLVAFALGRHRWRDAPDLWSVALLAGLASVVGALGGHPGAHMTYFFHLVTPALTVVALRDTNGRPPAQLAFAVLVPLAVVLNAHWFAHDLSRLARAESTFARVRTLIEDAANPAATSEFVPLLLAAGRQPLETGHSEFFKAIDPPWFLAPFWPPTAVLAAAERRSVVEPWYAFDALAFDVVIANDRSKGLITRALLEPRYRITESFTVELWWAQQSWRVHVWRPADPGHTGRRRAIDAVTSPELVDHVRRVARGDIPNHGLDILPDPSNREVFRGLSNATCTGIFFNVRLVATTP